MIFTRKNLHAALAIMCLSLSTHLLALTYSREFGFFPDDTETVQTKPALHRPNITAHPHADFKKGTLESGANPWHQHNQMMHEILGSHHPIRLSQHQDPRTEYITLQMQGDVAQLKSHKRALRHQLKRAWFGKKLIQAKINFINALLKAPLTKALANIKSGSLDEAYKVLHKLEVQFGCAEGTILTDPNVIRNLSYARKANGFDCINAARTLFENRSDYPEFLERKRKQQEEERTRAEESRISTQLYTIEESTAELLKLYEIDPRSFTKFSGNKLQQAMHQQFISIVNKAAELHHAHTENDSVKQCAGATLEFADIGREYNKQGFSKEALSVADFCWALVHYTKEIVIGSFQGIPLGIARTVNMICHPIDFVYGTLSMIHRIVDLQSDLEELATLHELDTNSALKKHQSIREKYRPIRDAIKKEIAKMTVRDWSRETVSIMIQILLQKKIPSVAKASIGAGKKKLHIVGQKASEILRKKPLELVTIDGQVLKVTGGPGRYKPKINSRSSNVPKAAETTINQSSLAILKDGYYEINGFKFSEYYYNRLWSKGRPAPTFTASAILENAKAAIPDRAKQGFFRYEFDGWEMVYNPITKEIWHLSPIKLTKAIE